MTDFMSDEDCAACAREAAAAIEVVLDQRCPELKRAFWSAVEKRYRPGAEPGGRLRQHRSRAGRCSRLPDPDRDCPKD